VTIDDAAAGYEYRAIEHLVVDAEPDTTYRAVRHLDLLRISSRLARAAFWVRGLPQALRTRRPVRVPTRVTFDDLVARGDWVLLGEDPPREVVFGAVGTFWAPVVRVEQVPAEEFADYGKPGEGKIVCSLSVRPYGRRRSLVTYDTRATITDPLSRRVATGYWWTVAPFIKTIMRATLRAARDSITDEDST
jgi:hypothetical protein